jgi:hypothetical protein
MFNDNTTDIDIRSIPIVTLAAELTTKPSAAVNGISTTT